MKSLDDEALRVLSTGWKDLPKLQSLKLNITSCSKVSDEGLKLILRGNSLRTLMLDLTSPQLLKVDGMKYFADYFKKNIQLETLEIKSSRQKKSSFFA